MEEVYQLYPEYYILKVNDFNRWSKVPLEQWMYFLSCGDIPDDADAPGLSAAKEKMLFTRMSNEEQREYRRYIDDRVILNDQIITARGEAILEGLAEGMEKGRAEGLAEGERKAGIDMARKLKSMGVLSVEQIADTTGLSAEEIEKL